MVELLSKDSETRCNTICNSFAINQFVGDHADPFLISESYRLLKKIKKQNYNMLTTAMSNGELALCTKEQLDFFNLKIMSTYRGLIRMSMTKCQEELEWNPSGVQVFMLMSEIIESLPWEDKTVPDINVIEDQVSESISLLKSVDVKSRDNETPTVSYYHGREKLRPKYMM